MKPYKNPHSAMNGDFLFFGSGSVYRCDQIMINQLVLFNDITIFENRNNT
jgi:hypothetical protein